MKFIDDGSKKLHWWNRNYFFAGTLLVVLINILVQAYASDWEWFYELAEKSQSMTAWHKVLSFENLFLHFASAFMHLNWQHALLNMLCFLICGGWLERRKGTFPLLGLVFVMAWMTDTFAGANSLTTRTFGYSCANYGFYAYAILDYIFLLLRKEERTLPNVISGAVLIGLIYFAACFSGGTSDISFKWFPYDFMHNMGHYSGFFAGALLGATVQIAKLIARKEACKEADKHETDGD